jgi:hypothetical protein
MENGSLKELLKGGHGEGLVSLVSKLARAG